MKKIIDLPEKVVSKLKTIATKERMTVKPFMEKVLIDYSKNNPVKLKPIE